MMRMQRTQATMCAVVVMGLGLAPAASGETTAYVWNLASSMEPCEEPCLVHFSLIGPGEPWLYMVQANVDVQFTTAGNYDASNFYLDLVGPIIQPDQSVGAAWNLTGQDLGWSGQGQFVASVATDVLNGELMTNGAASTFWTLHVGDFGHEFQGEVQVLKYTLILSDEPPVGAIPGDLDGDGVVGIADFLALLAAWGPCPAPPAECLADLDGDGDVGITDMLELLANWG